MPDVLLVFARADAARAHALAAMFESAGLSVGGAPADAADVRIAGAAVVLWSENAVRAQSFLNGVKDVVAAGRAVFVSLTTPPPIICSANPFDLSRWEGDPDDPALDPLFHAVQRRVAGAQDFVSLYLRRYRELRGLEAADDPVPRQMTLWEPAPPVPSTPPVAHLATPARSPPRARRDVGARRRSAAARRTAVGAIAAVAALCVLFISGGGGDTQAQVSMATAAPVIVQSEEEAPLAAAEPIELVDLQPVSEVAPPRAPPASAPENMSAAPASEEEAVFSARRAYRAQCSRYETAAFCTCVTAGLGQEISATELRAAQSGLAERLVAQSDAESPASASLQSEARYMNACSQFRRTLHG